MAGTYMSMGEAHRRISDYLTHFSDAVSYQNVTNLKPLLSISSNSPSLLSLADALILLHDANRLIRQSDNQFNDIVSPLFRALQNYRTSHLVDAYLAFEKAAKYVIQIIIEL